MRAGDLRILLETIPDDALVVIESRDHSFVEAGADYTTVVLEDTWFTPRGMRYKNIREYFGEPLEGFEENDKVVQAVIIS